MEKSDSFASDVVKQVLKDYRRFIIILIVFIFVNNIAWLIAWNYPSIRGEQVQVESDEGTAKATFVIVRIEGATPTNTVETTPHR